MEKKSARFSEPQVAIFNTTAGRRQRVLNLKREVQGRHQAPAWPGSDVLVRRRAARYSKQARRVYRTLFPSFRKTGPPPLTLFVSRVGTGSPVIRLASAVRTASSSQPGLACKMSVRDGRAGREEFCICSYSCCRSRQHGRA